jgi:hypothetical protein
MATTPYHDNNDVSFDDYKTANARFHSRLMAVQQHSEDSQSSRHPRSSDSHSRPVSAQNAVLA